jgi:hypothetical protein
MLTAEDKPTIRNAIRKRLDRERGVRVLSVPVKEHEDCIRVGVHILLENLIQLTADESAEVPLQLISRFELPLSFEHAHLVNEIDEIAEQCKKARLDWWMRGRKLEGFVELAGTGARGRWQKHA